MAERRLRIAEGVDSATLPLDVVTQSIGIIARRGAGKTYTAAVLSEELVRAGLPVVVLDPLGAFWGLRSSADGEKAGLPVTILGGDHGDVPLESAAGRVVAELVVDQPGAYILDLSGFDSNAAQDRFVTDFAERLYRLKASRREPLHLIVDEADSFAPQRPQPGQQRMLGAFEAIVRRGRIRGLGVTLITQRPAVLNKNVLTQIEVLIALQLTGPQDRAAVDEWVKSNATPEQREAFLGSLASLQQGQAWIWSPSWLQLFARVQIRRRVTFDSSRTPEPGEVLSPKRMAPVDLEQLRLRMQATIDKAKAEDPKELRHRIRELERELQSTPAPEKVVERVEVPVLNGQVERLKQIVDGFIAAGHDLRRVADILDNRGTALVAVGQQIFAAIDRVHSDPIGGGRAKGAPRGVPVQPAGDRGQTAVATLPSRHDPAPAPTEGRTKVQLSILSGYSIKSSSFANAIGALRSLGLAEGREPIVATAAGREAAGEVDPVPTGAALLEHWRGQLGKAERALLDVFVDAYPAELTREELSERSGYSLTSSSFANAIGRLRSLRLVDGLHASEDLF